MPGRHNEKGQATQAHPRYFNQNLISQKDINTSTLSALDRRLWFVLVTTMSVTVIKREFDKKSLRYAICDFQCAKVHIFPEPPPIPPKNLAIFTITPNYCSKHSPQHSPQAKHDTPLKSRSTL